MVLKATHYALMSRGESEGGRESEISCGLFVVLVEVE